MLWLGNRNGEVSAPLKCVSALIPVVVASSAEAEYAGYFKAAQEAELERTFLAEKNAILDAITAAIRELNADGKYHLVIDRSAAAANGMPTVIDVRGLEEITETVIASLK